MRALPALAQPHRIRDEVRRLGDPFEVANSLDCLILIDLRKTEPRVLRKYMSQSAWMRLQQRHRARSARRERHSGRLRLNSLRHTGAGQTRIFSGESRARAADRRYSPPAGAVPWKVIPD